MEDFIKKGIQLRSEIEKYIHEGNNNAARAGMENHYIDYDYDIEWCMLESALAYADGDYQRSKDILLPRYPQHEWNIDVNYNLGLFCYLLHDNKNAVKFFERCLVHEQLTDQLEKDIENLIEDMCKCDFQTMEYLSYYGNRETQLKRGLFCAFPGTFTLQEGKALIDNLIGKRFAIQNKEYYCGSYDRYFEERVGHPVDKKEDSRIFKTEVLQGEQVLDYNYYAKENTMLALMPLQKKQEITIKADEIEFKPGNLLPNHYYYYTFETGSRIEIKSAEGFVASKPFLLVQDAKKPKVIVNLFVDGLSFKYLDTVGLEELMPNTYSFFMEGTICRNAWSNSEWTHPSMASTFTGRYTLGKAGHRIFQPDYCSENLYEMELFPEVLQQNGYVCAKIDGEWRSTPVSGYAKGMDRTLYQPSLMNMFGENAIMEMVEHLETFKDCNNFVWVALPELHDISDEFESTVSTQMNTSLKYRKIEHTNGTSVRRGYDEGKVMRYKAQIKRIDVLLGMVYSYIESNYKENEYIVSLMSDHGQGYLTQENDEFF